MNREGVEGSVKNHENKSIFKCYAQKSTSLIMNQIKTEDEKRGWMHCLWFYCLNGSILKAKLKLVWYVEQSNQQYSSNEAHRNNVVFTLVRPSVTVISWLELISSIRKKAAHSSAPTVRLILLWPSRSRGTH